MRRSNPYRAILTKCGMWGDMVDIITCAIFNDCRLRGVWVWKYVSTHFCCSISTKTFRLTNVPLWTSDSLLAESIGEWQCTTEYARISRLSTTALIQWNALWIEFADCAGIFTRQMHITYNVYCLWCDRGVNLVWSLAFGWPSVEPISLRISARHFVRLWHACSLPNGWLDRSGPCSNLFI